MQLPKLDTLDFSDKKVVLRADLDVPVKENTILEHGRLDTLIPTISAILDKGAKQILIIGHRGRPEGKVVEDFSLKPLIPFFTEKISPDIDFIPHQSFSVYYQVQEEILKSTKRIVLLENLRFWPEEEQNVKEFAEQLAYGQDIYVNEAFGVSHRSHASIVGIPQFIKHAAGIQFSKEVENLEKVLSNPAKPVVSLISGVKKDKLEYLEGFKKISDRVLIAGRLPEFVPEDYEDHRVLVAQLNPDKEDITIRSIEKFEEAISTAGTIILSGPISKYEDPGHKLGTERVFMAISKSSAYKIAGGGDTQAAIKAFHIENTFNWISTGGGAMLEFLAKGTLPGIEALQNKNA